MDFKSTGQKAKSALKTLIMLIVLTVVMGGIGFVLVNYYSYIFSKNVKGVIAKVERITNPQTIVGTNVTSEQIFSYAVAVKGEQGEIFTASTEDRQWAVAQEGQCVEARFYPYPPWRFDKSGTYFGARLLRLFDCTSPVE